jgi:hypothetical protein
VRDGSHCGPGFTVYMYSKTYSYDTFAFQIFVIDPGYQCGGAHISIPHERIFSTPVSLRSALVHSLAFVPVPSPHHACSVSCTASLCSQIHLSHDSRCSSTSVLLILACRLGFASVPDQYVPAYRSPEFRQMQSRIESMRPVRSIWYSAQHCILSATAEP